MTYFDWGLIGVFFCSLVLIVWMLVRKRMRLLVINLETIAAEREARVREQLLRQRVQYWLRQVLRFRPIYQIAHRLDRFAHRLETDQRAIHEIKNSAGATVISLVHAAEIAIKRKAYEEAETQLVGALRQEPHNATVYHLLGLVKAATHAPKEAIDALSFAVQLQEKARSSGFLVEGADEDQKQGTVSGTDAELATMHMDLGMVFVQAGEHARALEHLENAVVLVPGNPRYLDALLTTAILLKNRKLAEEMLEQLRITNPENEKLAAFEKQIALLESPRRKKK